MRPVAYSAPPKLKRGRAWREKKIAPKPIFNGTVWGAAIPFRMSEEEQAILAAKPGDIVQIKAPPNWWRKFFYGENV